MLLFIVDQFHCWWILGIIFIVGKMMHLDNFDETLLSEEESCAPKFILMCNSMSFTIHFETRKVHKFA